MSHNLDIAHAHSSVRIIREFRTLIESQNPHVTATSTQIATLIEGMEKQLKSTPACASTAKWNLAIDALRILHGQLKCRDIARSGSGDIVNEQARVAVLSREFQKQLTAMSVVSGDENQFVEGDGERSDGSLDSQQLIAFLREWTLPITYWKSTPEPFPRVLKSSTEDNEEVQPTPLVRVIASFDNSPLVSPQLLQPQLLYSLAFTIRGIGWYAGAKTLRLDLITTCPPNEYSVSDFVLHRPASFNNTEYEGEMSGQISFRSAQSILSDELSFIVRCAFELPDGGYVEVPVIGHNQLDFRVVSPDGVGLMSGYRRLDKHLVELLTDLLKTNPQVQRELTELLPVLDAITSLIGTYAQGAVFKRTRTLPERQFQAEVLRDLRIRLGEDVQEHPSQGGGIADIRYRGVVIELKVEQENGDRKHIGQKYAPQCIQYEGVEARQVGIVMVLDLTPKDDPPGDIRGDILMIDVPTHGGEASTKPYPSKAFVFVVNGNIRNPSDYSA